MPQKTDNEENQLRLIEAMNNGGFRDESIGNSFKLGITGQKVSTREEKERRWL